MSASPPARTGPAHGAGRRPRGRPDPDPVALVPGAAAAAGRPGAGLQDRTHLALRRGRPRLVLEQLLLWRGTHFDAPVHWISGRDHPANSVDTIAPEHFIAPAVVLDASAEVAQNEDWLLTVEFIQDWERRHGRIPPRAWVLLRLVAARAGSGRLPQPARGRRAHARPDAGSRAMADPRATRTASGWRPSTPMPVSPMPGRCPILPHADAWRQPLRPAMPEEPGSAAAAGRMILAAPLKIEGGSGSPGACWRWWSRHERAKRNPGGVRRQRHQFAGRRGAAGRARRVLVLERNDRLGGCIRTENCSPATGTKCSRPGIRYSSAARYAELKSELEQAGLEVLCGDYSTGLVGPDGRGLALRQDMADAARRLDALARRRPGLQDMAARMFGGTPR